MQIILDVFWVKQFERVNKFKFSNAQLDEARNHYGVTNIVHDNKIYEIRIPYIKFPFELMAEDIQNNEYTYPELKLPWDL